MAKNMKLLEQLKNVAERICILRPKIDVPEIRLAKVAGYESNLEHAWEEFKNLYAKIQCEDKADEGNSVLFTESEVLYKEQKELYEKLDGILRSFKEAAAEFNPSIGEQKQQKETDGSIQSWGHVQQSARVEQSFQRQNPEEKYANIADSPIAGAITEVERRKRRFFTKLGELEGILDRLGGTLGSLSESVLRARKNRLNSSFEDLRRQYDGMINDRSFDDLENDFSAIQNEYYNMMEEIAYKEDGLRSEISSSYTKLEDVKIPKFYGNIDEWPAFHDLFGKLVDEKPSISKVEKLYRLKSIVQGEAGKLIQHLQITSDNYEAAWTILRQRYENKRLLFSNLADKIMDQPNVNSQSAASIKQMLDVTTECLQALKAMGMTLKDADPFIARILIRKLHREGLVWYEQSVQKTKEIQSLNDVLNFLEQQYLAQEAVKPKNKINLPSKAPAKYTNTYQTTQVICKYCNITGHGIECCRRFGALSIVDKKKFISEESLCKLCLNHKSFKKCFKYKNSCSKCGSKHHVLLHDDEFEEKKSSQQDNNPRSTNLVTLNDTSVALLATAQIRIKSGLGELIVLRALIDQGSQRTSISEEAAQILKLPKKKITTELIGLGNTIVGVSKATMELTIYPRFISDTIHHAEALVLKNLASAHPDKSFSEDMGKWRNYCLADPNFNRSDRIDVVLGLDVFNQIMQPGMEKRGTLICQPTTLGWILSGVLNVEASSTKVLMAVTRGIERFF